MGNNILELKIYVDGVNDTPFPQGAEEPIEIGAFRYDAKRMGGAPTITASVDYPTCLDNEWTDNVYAEFNGEKYYLKQTPTSSYDNVDTMYKHDITLVTNLHDDRNSRFDNHRYHNKLLSSYTNIEWVDWVKEVVIKEIYAQTQNNSRAYTNVCSVYDKIKIDFYHRLTN